MIFMRYPGFRLLQITLYCLHFSTHWTCITQSSRGYSLSSWLQVRRAKSCFWTNPTPPIIFCERSTLQLLSSADKTVVLISCSVHRRTQKSMCKIEYQKHFENALYMTNWLYNKTNGGDAVEHEQLTTLILTKKLGFALFSIKCHWFIVFEVYCALISNHWALKLVLILFLQHFIT